MEEVLAGFAADGEAACCIGAGAESALYGFADVHVFILDAVAHGDAFGIAPVRVLAHVSEIEVELHEAAVGIEGQERLVSMTPW